MTKKEILKELRRLYKITDDTITLMRLETILKDKGANKVEAGK